MRPQGGVDDDNDGEDEQPSDEAMFRMDAMVAAVLQKGAAGRPNARESREHLRNFKFRCRIRVSSVCAVMIWFEVCFHPQAAWLLVCQLCRFITQTPMQLLALSGW